MRGKKSIKVALAMLILVTAFFATGLTVYAVPAAPGVTAGDEDGACHSVPGDQLVTLELLKEKQAAAAKGQLRNAPAADGSRMTEKTAYSVPLLILVVGFEGSSKTLPDGISYNSEYDWGETVFRQERSLAGFYSDMSYGQFTFTPAKESSAYGVDGNTNVKDTANDGIVHVTVSNAHGRWGDSSHAEHLTHFDAFKAAILAADDYVDFSAYDTNGNGVISTDELALGIIVAGYEASAEDRPLSQLGEDQYLWAHAASLSYMEQGTTRTDADLPRPDGTLVNNYIAVAETIRTYSGSEVILKQAPLGVMAHELGHYLGLPDLYDVDYLKDAEWSDYEVYKLSLMASGSWAQDQNGEYTIYPFDPWCRIKLDWMLPTLIEENGIYTVTTDTYRKTEDVNCYLILTANEGELFLIENRGLGSWDNGISKFYKYTEEGSGETKLPEGGIVIWHLDETVLEEYRERENTADHRPFIMPLFPEKESDGSYTLIRKKKGGSVVKQPFLTAEYLTENCNELSEGFRLPYYGGGSDANSLGGRFNSCIGLQILSDTAGTDMQFQVKLDNHIPLGQDFIENRVEATSRKDGGYDLVHYCMNCGMETDRTHYVIPKILVGWQKSGSKWYYYDSKGKKLTGWQEIDKKWYYFGSDGVMKTGWLSSGNKWYFLSSDGTMKTGWKQLGGKWYYFNSNGTMKTGWLSSGGKWYYFSKDGTMAVGWKEIGGKWYFFRDGAMKTGWLSSGGKWYYFTKNGEMVTGTVTIGGVTYRFNAAGICLNP